MHTQTDNTVAIVALGVTASVALLGAFIAAWFQRSRQRDELRQARHLDLIQEQRRVIFAALEQLVQLDLLFDSPSLLKAESEAVTAAFTVQLLRLMSLFGRDGELGRAYQQASNELGALVRATWMDSAATSDAAKVELRISANAARDRFVEAAKPYLIDTTAERPSGT